MTMTTPPETLLTRERIQSALAALPAREENNACRGAFTQAAVLVPLVNHHGAWEMLFTRRTDTVENHKGQVAFPGGAVEPQDRTLEDAALREAWEEIGLPPASVRLLGRLPLLSTITGYCVTPVVGEIVQRVVYQPAPAEVSRVFQVPLDWLADPQNWEWRWFTRPNGLASWVIFYQPYDGEVIWGVTASIVHSFLAALGWLEASHPPDQNP